MNGKKLWLFAILFGLISSTVLYLVVEPSGSEKSNAEKVAPTEREKLNTTPTPQSQLLPITEGKRALTISVNELQGISGFIIPGSYVDVIATLPEDNSKLLVENTKVLAVGRTTTMPEDASTNNYQTITLEISPEEGIAITNATSKGVINLMLRGSTISQ